MTAAAEFEAEGDLAWRYRPAEPGAPAGTATLVVVFSQARVPFGRFGLSRLFATTRHDCLFLNCRSNGWYIGLDDGLDRAIGRAIATSKPERVIYYGCSMGAYGALATALRRRDGACYAFGPDLPLGRPGSQSAGYLGADRILAGADLPALLAVTDRPPVHLIFGALEAADAGSAAFVREHIGQRDERLVLASPHAVHDHLYTLNVVRALIARFDRPLGALCRSRGLLSRLSDGELAAFAALGARHLAGERLGPEDLAASPALESHAGYRRLLADALARDNAHDEAIGIYRGLDRAFTEDPVLSRTPKRYRKGITADLVALLEAAGRPAEAEDLKTEAARRFAPGRLDKPSP